MCVQKYSALHLQPFNWVTDWNMKHIKPFLFVLFLFYLCIDAQNLPHLAGKYVERQLCRDAILPMPAICEVPCPKDCVLSPWTAWSLCSHTCSGKNTEGKQTRARSILAYNAGEGRNSKQASWSKGSMLKLTWTFELLRNKKGISKTMNLTPTKLSTTISFRLHKPTVYWSNSTVLLVVLVSQCVLHISCASSPYIYHK